MLSRLVSRPWPLSYPYRVRSLLSCTSGNGRTTLTCFYSSNQQKNRVGIALCGFGRAGQIHFHGIRQNYRCNLKYVVEAAETMSSVQEFLERYNLSSTAKAISTEEFENVPH